MSLLIPHSFMPRSMFDMDLWSRPIYPGFGTSTLDLFDPFDELDRMIGRNFNWLVKPPFMSKSNARIPNKFRVTIDCTGYSPKSIKTEVKDGKLTVSGSEGEAKANNDEDFSMKQFRKTYKLPENADADKLASFMTSNGRLVVEVPLKINENEKTRLSTVRDDFFPRINEENKTVSMSLALPEGIDPAKINVTCKDRELVVKYQDKKETNDSFSNIYFYKQVLLPENTEFNSLKCSYENNMLSITAPLNTDFKDKQASVLPIEIKNKL